MITRTGMFGPVAIRDTFRARELLINGQVQGGAFHQPSAHDIDSSLSDTAPGPVSSANYADGWLLAGVNNPVSSGLMIGLGSGSGAVQLVNNFPGVDLTIVEIDPVVVQLALDNFPLIEHYMDRGLLNIVLADADQYLEGKQDRWTFALVDAYTGAAGLVDSYLPALIDRADDLYLNVIDSIDGPSMAQVMQLLQERDKPVVNRFKSIPIGLLDKVRYGCRSNWILTTQPVNWSRALQFEPFSDLEPSEAVFHAQRSWDQFLASAEDRAELKDLLASRVVYS